MPVTSICTCSGWGGGLLHPVHKDPYEAQGPQALLSSHAHPRLVAFSPTSVYCPMTTFLLLIIVQIHPMPPYFCLSPFLFFSGIFSPPLFTQRIIYLSGLVQMSPLLWNLLGTLSSSELLCKKVELSQHRDQTIHLGITPGGSLVKMPGQWWRWVSVMWSLSWTIV